MKDKPIVIFCPNPYSFYTNSLCELLLRKGYTVDSIVVRKFTFTRFKNEIRRDGLRLIKKIWKKLVLREKAYTGHKDDIMAFRKKNNLTVKNVKKFKSSGVKLVYCKNLNDKVVEKNLDRLDEKLVAFTGGGIIRKNVLKRAGDGIINCHMGILPRYKGMDLPEWAVLENRPDEIGLTLHFMNEGIDTGELLKLVKIPLQKDKSIKDLRTRFEPIMIEAMLETVEGYLDGSIVPKAQPKGENRQYFIVHPSLAEIADKKIKLFSKS